MHAHAYIYIYIYIGFKTRQQNRMRKIGRAIEVTESLINFFVDFCWIRFRQGKFFSNAYVKGKPKP